MRRFVVGTLVAVALAAPASAAAPSYRALVEQFAYDGSAPLRVRLSDPHACCGSMVEKLSFIAAGRRWTGVLVKPTGGKPPFAGMIFMPGANETHGFFRLEADDMATHGVESVVVDNDPHLGFPTFTAKDQTIVIRRVVALRRAIDVLLARGVDPKRIGYAGHGDGGELGAILAGVDHRLRAAELLAASGAWDPCTKPGYRNAIATVQSGLYVGHAAPTALFLQFARNDEYNARPDEQRFARTATAPKLVRWYVTDHTFSPQAYHDGEAWLLARLPG